MKKDANILVTGGAGFIGSRFIIDILQNTNCRVINLDKLTYAGNPENLGTVDRQYPERYRFIKGDICDAKTVADIFAAENPEAVINFAAETHVDRSIENDDEFLKTNVLGTGVLLKAAMKYFAGSPDKLFIQISTDEVYGAIESGDEKSEFTEKTPLDPRNPYSASKAAADMLVSAYVHTHGLPAIITRCSNNFGAGQYPEKLIPVAVKNACGDRPVPVYGDGTNIRDWIFVDDHVSAVRTLLFEGKPGEIYNIGANNRITNLELVKKILSVLGKPESLISFVVDRPGHDYIYRMSNKKITRETDWRPSADFDRQLRQCVLEIAQKYKHSYLSRKTPAFSE